MTPLGRVMASAIWLPIVAAAAELPVTREGLWDIRVHTVAKPTRTKTDTRYKVCRDPAVEKEANDLWSHVRGCSATTERLSEGRYAVKTRCVADGKVILTQGTVSYQGQITRHSETQVSYTPAIAGKSGAISVADERWLGPCPSNMRPGDRQDADGKVHPPGK